MNVIPAKDCSLKLFLTCIFPLFFCICVITIPINNASASDFTEEVVMLETRSSVTQKFLLLTPVQKPSASIVLFPGGNGKLALSDSGSIRANDQNLVVRIKEKLAKAGFTIALVDAPTDKQGRHGMHAGSHRVTGNHEQDIRAVIDYLKKQYDVPVWFMGFSMGSHSAAYLAGAFNSKIDGIVMASSVTNWKVFKAKSAYKAYPNGILDIDLDKIVVPVLILHHKKDKCKGSLSSNIPRVAAALTNSPKVDVTYISGGFTHSNPCGPMGYHGFKGKEKEALNAIIDFIKPD